MKVALCLITRLSNKYLREWVCHYKSIGFDKIYIYDNNRPGEDICSDEISDYIDNGFVEVIDFSNAGGRVQEKAYQDCYDSHNEEYDWMAFFDDDEYLMLNVCDNIKDFLSMDIFNEKYIVSFPMVNFSDNEIIINNKKTRLDVYTKVLDKENLCFLAFYKSITRCGLNANFLKTDIGDGIIYEENCHVPLIDNKLFERCVDCDGNVPEKDIRAQFPTKNAYLKHIPTGSIDDYINGKRKRGWPDEYSPMQYAKENVFGYDYFLMYNKDSAEKRMYFEENKLKH